MTNPRTERIDAAALVARTAHAVGQDLRPAGELGGGEVGAALAARADGSLVVVSRWPAGQAARARRVDGLLGILRGRGYPAPRFLAVGDLGDATAVVQEYVTGAPPNVVGAHLLDDILRLNDLQRDAVDIAGGGREELYLDRDGPGFCLHAPMREHSAATAALAARIDAVAAATPQHVGRGTDVVHYDFHRANLLVRPHRPHNVAAVIDWTGGTVGDAALDLVTLGFSLTAGGVTPAAARLRDVLRTRADEVTVRAFVAHMAQRQVDWMVRHHGRPQIEHWTQVATEWLDRAGPP